MLNNCMCIKKKMKFFNIIFFECLWDNYGGSWLEDGGRIFEFLNF